MTKLFIVTIRFRAGQRNIRIMATSEAAALLQVADMGEVVMSIREAKF